MSKGMDVLAVAAQKGGVGKTTTTIYTANYAAQALGSTVERPLVGIIDREETRNLTKLVRIGEAQLAPGVELLPGYDVPRGHPTLRLVVVDTPPGYMAIKSLDEANLVTIPAIPESNGIVNLVDYLKLLDDAKVSVNPRMRLVAVLPTMVMNNGLHRQRLEEIKAITSRRRPPLVVLDAIPRRVTIARYEPSPEYAAATAEMMHHAAIG
jgi:cellulose biosynthesis protein BcsQ